MSRYLPAIVLGQLLGFALAAGAELWLNGGELGPLTLLAVMTAPGWFLFIPRKDEL